MWDGNKVGGYDDHPVKDPIKGSSYEKASDSDKQRAKRRFRIQQIKNRRLNSEEKSNARRLIEWVRDNANNR